MESGMPFRLSENTGGPSRIRVRSRLHSARHTTADRMAAHRIRHRLRSLRGRARMRSRARPRCHSGRSTWCRRRRCYWGCRCSWCGTWPRVAENFHRSHRDAGNVIAPANPMWKVLLVSTGKLRRAVVDGSPVDQEFASRFIRL
jgi:hypothetical protein